MASIKQKNLNARNTLLKKYFSLIVAIVIIFMLFLSYLFIVMPKYNNTELLIKTNIADQKKLYALHKRKLDSLRILNELYEKIPAEEISKFNSVLPSKYQAETLFGELEEVIESGGWTLNSVSWNDLKDSKQSSNVEKRLFLESLAESQIGVIEVQLKLQNLDYAGVKEMLSVFENNLRLFDIANLSFSGESNAELTLYTYYYEK